MNTIKIEYTTSVYTAAGWRSVDVTALAEKLSEKMAIVEEVLEIDGETPNRNQSRTGAKRQRFNGSGIALREVGKKKRLATCEII